MPLVFLDDTTNRGHSSPNTSVLDNSSERRQCNRNVRRRSTESKEFKFIHDSGTHKSNRRESVSIRETASGQRELVFLDDEPVFTSQTTESKKRSSSKVDSHKDPPEELKIDNLSKAVFKAGYNIRELKLDDILHNDISDEFLQGLYFISAYTINNYFGTPSPSSVDPQKLSTFLDQLIPLNSGLKMEIIRKSKNIQPPPFTISIHILEAMDLVATDPDGLSDPFCKIWLNEKKTLFKTTEVKEHTLDPVWNETFQFKLSNLKKDIIYIEIWDSDPTGFRKNLLQIRNVRSIRGCWCFCADLMEAVCHRSGQSVDDFIGKTEIEVGNLYSEGINEWFALKTSKDNPQQGKLRVAMRIEVTKPKNTIDALKRHLLLVKLCLDNGFKDNLSNDLDTFPWEEILNSSSRTLLFQHSVQGNISAFEDSACRFIIIIQLALQHSNFNFQFLYKLLKETNENMKISQSSNGCFNNPLEDVYVQSLNTLKDNCHRILSSLHTFDITKDETKRTQFQFVLKCLCLYEDMTGTDSDIWIILKSEADNWSVNKAQDLKNIKAKDRNKSIMKFLNFLQSFQMAADEAIKSVFPEKNYTQEIYETCQRHLWEPLKSHVREMAKESGKSKNVKDTTKKEEVLEIFIKLKEVSNYFNSVLQTPRQLQVGQLHEWFGSDTIHDWFDWKKQVVSDKLMSLVIKDALENELVELPGRHEKQTASVQQTLDLIQKEFYPIWELVSDSNCSECVDSFVSRLHSCCWKYTESLIDQIYLRKLSHNFHSGGKKKLCAIANNLWALAWFVKGILDKSGITLQRNFPDTKFSLQMVCKILCADISEKFKRDIVHHITNVAEAKTKKEQKISLAEYTEFMNILIKREAAVDMAFEIYLLFFSNVWKYVIMAVSYYKNKPMAATCLNRVRKCCRRSPNRYEGLLTILKETEQLCYFDKEGKLKNVMISEEYKTLTRELESMKLHS